MIPAGRKLLSAIVLVGLLARVGFVVTREDRYYFPDTRQYAGIALNLLKHGSLSFDDDHRACRSPGYPVFLAVCFRAFRESRLAVRLVQAVIGGITCLVVYALARELFDEVTGITRPMRSCIASAGMQRSTPSAPPTSSN